MEVPLPEIPRGKYGCFPPNMRTLLEELDELTGVVVKPKGRMFGPGEDNHA